MPKLTDTQLVILSTAAQRDDGAAQPLPKSLKLQGGAATAALKSLLTRKLLAEQPAAREASLWRETSAGERLMLVITDAGRGAIGVVPEETSTSSELPDPQKAASKSARTQAKKTGSKAKTARKAPATATRPGTKQSLLVDLLSRRQGATVAEAVKATGWQPHSVRGAISGGLKKKLRLRVTSEKVDGRGRVYRVVSGR